jgi:hypothetical protein
MIDYGWAVAVAHELGLLDEDQLFWVLRRMTLPQLRALLYAWPVWAHRGSCRPKASGACG